MSSEDLKELEIGKSSNVDESETIKLHKPLKLSKFKKEEKLSNKMFTHARETICFFLALAFTALAALHSTPPRISKPPVARPFFNENSVVLDFYKGHLGALVDRVTDTDFSFVMYYAPWDAECQSMKEEFDRVARYFHPQVFFAAINCWHPGSECRARYSKIQSYPVFMLYPSRESGIQYKGIKSAPYMIRFIRTFINPIVRVTNDEEIMQMLTFYDAVVLGYFNFNGLRKSPGYREFYRTAIRSLEKDPNGEIVFCAITSENYSKDHGVTAFPTASLLLWNETLFYPESNEWSAENLSNWISDSVHRVVTWLQPPGTKSLTIAPYLWEGPVLFLFTPRNPLHFDNNNYNLLKEVGLQYYDCSNNKQVSEIVTRLKEDRLKSKEKILEKQEWCMNFLKKKNYRNYSFLVAKSYYDKKNESCCSNVPTNKCTSCWKTSKMLKNTCQKDFALTCKKLDIFDTPFFYEENYDYYGISNMKDHHVDGESCFVDSCHSHMANGKIDQHSSDLIKKIYYKEDCRMFLTGFSYQEPIFPKKKENMEELNLSKSICKKINKTLALVAIDSLYYFHFAESLGIDIYNVENKTIAVILDPKEESQFVMKEEFGRDSLVRFVNNYSQDFLDRTLRAVDPKKYVTSITKSKCSSTNKSSICIPELNSQTFLKTVLNPDKDVVVMYHSPYCAFCSAVSYVYLTVAHYLSKMDHLEFVRIDGDNNDLPWEYTMSRYPTILFFPARRKEDSTIFPSTLPISVGNLLNFVLANLDEESHIEALINVCSKGVGSSSIDCINRIRWLCLDVISEFLKDFRKLRRLVPPVKTKNVINARRVLLLKLEHVRDINLVLSSADNLYKDKQMVKILRHKFKRHYRALDNMRRALDKNILPSSYEKNSENNEEHIL